MNGQIVYDIVVKPGPVPQFYEDVPSFLIPFNIRKYLNAYAYEFIEGRRAGPDDVESIIGICERHVWKLHAFSPRVSVERKFGYRAYVASRISPALSPSVMNTINTALDIIQEADLREAHTVHGDLTFENVIVQPSGDMVFIDPGDPRGMITPSLDRGKLLQSVVMRWEERTSNIKEGSFLTQGDTMPWENPNPWPAWASRIDWAFLVTHWVRLMRHWPGWNTASAWPVLERIRP